MKIIEKEFFKTRFPCFNEVNIDEMDKGALDYYLSMYSLYSEMLYKYLIKDTSIKKLDENIKNSDLTFKKVNDDDKDFYQDLATDFLEYLYIRNNLHIERLTVEDFQILENCILRENFELTSEIENLIKSTLQKVIFEEVKGDEIISINYGPDSPLYYVSNNSLVIGMRYDDVINDFSNDQELELDDKRYTASFKIRNIISEILTKELGIDVVCLTYYSDSVIKKNELNSGSKNK